MRATVGVAGPTDGPGTDGFVPVGGCTNQYNYTAVTRRSGRQGTMARSKIERVVEKRDLGDLAAELELRWTDEEDRNSLRELAELFNQRVLEAALREAGQSPLDGEVENLYRLLTADDVSPGMRTQARRQLERTGVDVEDLTDDFVSHQTVHTYLTERRGVKHDSDSRNPVETGRERLARLRSRTETVSRETVESLRERDAVDIGEFDVIVDLQVLCEECGTQLTIEMLLEEGSCRCDETG